ncbi:MAG TPA: hypothetical protein GX009_14185 [Candidatus Atribacteria bacterium]|nr:hypothetical protein [Candidatus Atribacteria bacterium]
MKGKIYLIQKDDELVEMEEKEYENEDLLQKLLVDYPDLLAGELINDSNPRRWLLISREMDVPTKEDTLGKWSADHLFIDQDAIPTIVEVKRSSDTRIRREVIGQMLDYAANGVVYWPVEKIKSKFEDKHDEPEAVLSKFLDDESNVDDFWMKLKTNLQAGKIRMLFVADELPKDLKRVIEFLNEQMDPAEVLGIEIKQFSGEGIKTLVPRIIGQTEESKTKKSTSMGRIIDWDEKAFFTELEKNRGNEETRIAIKLNEWFKNNFQKFAFKKNPSFAVYWPYISHDSADYLPFAINTNGQISIYFQYLKDKKPFNNENFRLELLKKVNEIENVHIPIDRIGGRPNFPLNTLNNDKSMQNFIKTLEWTLEKIKES